MFKRIKLRLRDMKTISQLISGADEQANKFGDEEPGAEHFVLSALNLPDDSAKRVFARIDADADGFRTAINRQYSHALHSVGINTQAIETDPEPIESTKVFNNSKPSGVAVMKLLYALKKEDKDRPILGAHILSVVSQIEQGVVPRAFKTMGIEPSQLSQAVKDELDSIPI